MAFADFSDNFLSRTAGLEDFIRRSQGLPVGNMPAESALAQLSQQPQQVSQPQPVPAEETPFRESFLGNLASAFIPGVAGTFAGQQRQELAEIMQDPSLSREQKTEALAAISLPAATKFSNLEQSRVTNQLRTQQTAEIQNKLKQGITEPLTKGLPDNFMWQKDPVTGQQKAVKIPGLENIIDLTPDIEGEQKLRKEFNGQIEEFNKVNRSYARVKASVKDPSAAGDLSLIFNFMKMLDPGSVVRESEFATAQNAASVPQRVRAFYNRIVDGERMSEVQRADFTDRANKLFVSQRSIAEESKKAYDDLATEYGFKPDRITTTFQPISESVEDDEDIEKSGTAEEQAELLALEAEFGIR